MVEQKRAGLFRYLKEAFLFKWNALILGGATAAGIISGHPDIALPLIAAAEVTYLAGLATLPRFQAAIDARVRYEAGQGPGPKGTNKQTGANKSVQNPGAARDRIMDVLKSLTEDRRSRFLRLRARCVEMSRIANAVRGEAAEDPDSADRQLRQPALDRLLWVFLKLLLSDQSIGRFLQAADSKQIDQTLADLQARIAKRQGAVPEADREADRILRSLADSIATAEVRKENVEKSKSNQEFVQTELDRLENKIQAVTEMAVGHSDPDEMSSRIDAISEGISQTEQTIRDLQNLTGMAADQSEAPSILDTDLTVQKATH